MRPDQIVSIVIPVYRDAERAATAATSILGQCLPDGMEMEIIVVDDGSGDGAPRHILGLADSRIRLLPLSSNQGRSAARNAGAALARGAFVVFMDCDCLPVGPQFLIAHIHTLRAGAVASTGDVVGTGAAFWDLYQSDASSRRRSQHDAGHQYTGSSQNLAVQRCCFEQVEGFDTGYRRYGFEDRDLLLRLGQLGSIAWTGDAVVRHLDAISLEQVSRKMVEAGEFSSARFASRHPDAYETLGYGRIDTRGRRWLVWAARIAGNLLAPASRMVDSILPLSPVPYSIKARLVRAVSGLSYLVGTARRDHEAG